MLFTVIILFDSIPLYKFTAYLYGMCMLHSIRHSENLHFPRVHVNPRYVACSSHSDLVTPYGGMDLGQRWSR